MYVGIFLKNDYYFNNPHKYLEFYKSHFYKDISSIGFLFFEKSATKLTIPICEEPAHII